MRQKHLGYIIIVLLAISVALLFLSPFNEVIEKAKEQNLVFVATTISISEICFLGGIVTMAYAVGHDIGWNPVRWRGHFKQVVRKVSGDRLFWVGFWMNFIGALGTTLIFTVLTIILLPPQSWGIALIGSIDLIVTIALRYEVMQLRKL